MGFRRDTVIAMRRETVDVIIFECDREGCAATVVKPEFGVTLVKDGMSLKFEEQPVEWWTIRKHDLMKDAIEPAEIHYIPYEFCSIDCMKAWLDANRSTT